uniref:Uncharacterized protein n=1 Tax=Romanomermis culicivorax TaxID=13658 RepID=A0A915IQN7_ROMCU
MEQSMRYVRGKFKEKKFSIAGKTANMVVLRENAPKRRAKDLLNFEASMLFDLKDTIEKCRFSDLLSPYICFNFYYHMSEKLHVDQISHFRINVWTEPYEVCLVLYCRPIVRQSVQETGVVIYL